jgi:hypothetical protein
VLAQLRDREDGPALFGAQRERLPKVQDYHLAPRALDHDRHHDVLSATVALPRISKRHLEAGRSTLIVEHLAQLRSVVRANDLEAAGMADEAPRTRKLTGHGFGVAVHHGHHIRTKETQREVRHVLGASSVIGCCAQVVARLHHGVEPTPAQDLALLQVGTV